MKGGRPTLRFVGWKDGDTWEMLSLKERLGTVHEALKIHTRALVNSERSNDGYKKELDKLQEENKDLKSENAHLRG